MCCLCVDSGGGLCAAELLRLAKKAFVDSFVKEITGSDYGRCLGALCNSVWNACAAGDVYSSV